MTIEALDAEINAAGGAAAVVAKGLSKAQRDAQAYATKGNDEPLTPTDPLAALSKWAVTKEQVDAMTETRMIWRDIIAGQHLAVWSAPGNGGKTSLAKFAAGELAQAHRVLFFQEDASAGDLPALFQHAEAHGYKLFNSTLAGSATDDQISVLRRLVKDGASLDGVVMFFDTLKKYNDLMSKGGSRAFFKLMRSLTQRGATIVLLGHTNKHRGVDGKLMFEGVGDVRNDVDELIYIDATDKDPRGVVTLTMRPDKTRCVVRETTFEIDTKCMEVRALDRVVDVAAMVEQKRQLEEDQALISCVRSALARGGMKHTELRDIVVADSGRSRKNVVSVIDRYLSYDVDDPQALWIETRFRVNNTRHISLKPRPA